MTDTDVRAAARAAFLEAVHRGKPLTGAELARRFGKTPGWGRKMRREFERDMEAEPRDAEPVPRQTAEPVARHTDLVPLPALPAEVRPRDATAGPRDRDTEPAVTEPVRAAGPRDDRAVSKSVMRTAFVAAIVVGAVAAVGCYVHLYRLAEHAGEPWPVCLAYPLLIEGFMVVATLAAVALRTWLAWLSLGIGLAASMAGNALSVAPELLDDPTHLKVAVGVSFSVALFLTVKLYVQLAEARS